MGNTLKYFLLLVFGVATFWSCSDDDFYNENYNNTYNEKGLKISRITGSKAEQLAGKLKIETLSNTGVVYKTTNTGTINYDEILEVIDTLGNTNYTFRIEGHPKESERSFFNLVVNVKDGQQKVYVLEYEMDEDFVLAYSSGQKSLEQFDGMITAGRLGEEVPCPEFEIPIRGGVGNGGNNPGNGSGDSNPSNPGGGDGGSPGGGEGGGHSGTEPLQPYDPCPDLECDFEDEIKEDCNCIALVSISPRLFKVGNNLIVENFGKKLINPNDPCADFELIPIGVLPSTKSNCQELKNKDTNQELNQKLAELKGKAANQGYESAYVMYQNASQGLMFSDEFTGDPNGNEEGRQVWLDIVEAGTMSTLNCIGFVHCHLDDGTTYKVFSVTDILALAQVADLSTRPQQELVVYVVTSSGTFALKVSSKIALKNHLNLMQLAFEGYEEKFDKFVKMEQPVEEQKVKFLQFVEKYLPNAGLELYEKDETTDEWKKLELKPNKKSIKEIKCQ